MCCTTIYDALSLTRRVMQEEDQLDSPSQEKPTPKKRGKWKAAEGQLTQKRNEMDKAKVWHIHPYRCGL